MATKDESVSFNEVIQAARQRRKNETLANEILLKGRRPNLPGNGKGSQRALSSSSLASRAGIKKRSSSSSNAPKSKPNIDRPWSHDLHHHNNPSASRGGSQGNQRVANRLANDKLSSIFSSGPTPTGPTSLVNINNVSSNGFSIRGIAGPFTIIGSNFAPGTTASDIESALLPVGGEMMSCQITGTQPVVTAEMVYENRDSADNIISTFNNQKADGRTLRMYLKLGSPQPRVSQTHAEYKAPSSFPDYTPDQRREQADRDRRRPMPEVMDGTYGFQERSYRRELDDRREVEDEEMHDQGLYSDNILSRGGRGDYDGGRRERFDIRR
ncbi:MAG: hypothetical protein M1829_005882 [Trizodia sp. TS-e1964]|nr:MAG: hypothetical protein M1829_005882 [Trizodia sp. TS-e1964]